VKDNVVPNNAPPLDALVGFEVTYVSSAGVLSRCVRWGQVRDYYYHPGDSDGHHIKGDYVHVLMQDGDDLFVHFDDIISVNPAR